MAWPPRSWLRDLTGRDDDSPDAVVDAGAGWVVARATGRRMYAGRLHLPSLGDLRQATAGAGVPGAPPLTLRTIMADTVAPHVDPADAGAPLDVAMVRFG
jgi:hypothetical protein